MPFPWVADNTSISTTIIEPENRVPWEDWKSGSLGGKNRVPWEEKNRVPWEEKIGSLGRRVKTGFYISPP